MPDVELLDTQLRKSVRSKSVSEEGPAFVIGTVVFAHKGQAVPYWRPGVVVKIKPRSYYSVKFFGDLVEHDCTKSNMMPFGDFDRRKTKSKGSKLFLVPLGKDIFFQRCIDDAKKS